MADAICTMKQPVALYDPQIGEARVIAPGDRLDPDAAIVQANEWAFEIPAAKRSRKADVEAATAAPGEKRTLTS